MRSGEAAQFCLQEGPITAYIDAICFKICRIPQQINCFRGLKFRTFMTQRPPFIYGIAAWMILNIVLMGIILLNGDTADLNNWIEIVLWATSIAGLLSMRKWGVAFAIFVLVYTLSTSVGILIYYGVWINAVRVAVNVPVIVYLFKALFEGKFK